MIIMRERERERLLHHTANVVEMHFIVDSDRDAMKLVHPLALNYKTHLLLDLLGTRCVY